MRHPLLLSAIAAGMLLSGCASNRYCLGEQAYQNAEERPVLEPVGDLKLPESPTALRIPPPVANPVPYGAADAEGNGVCLDKPPYYAAVDSIVTPDPKRVKKK